MWLEKRRERTLRCWRHRHPNTDPARRQLPLNTTATAHFINFSVVQNFVSRLYA